MKGIMLDEQARNLHFPSLAGITYLNTAAEGIPPRAVGAALQQYSSDKLRGMAGREAHFKMLERLKQRIAKLFGGLSAEDVAFCSCSSEAFNLAAITLRLKEGDEVIASDLEFPSAVTPWLAPNSPATLRLWRSRQGALRVEDLLPLLGPRTRLIAVSLVSFYNGFTIPLQRVVETVRRHSGALIALDVTQALGRIPLEVDVVDLIVSSTHKWILGTHGGGIVGVPAASKDRWHVRAGGWFSIENAFAADRFDRADTRAGAAGFAVGMPNFPAVYGVCAAIEFIESVGVNAIDDCARPLVRACIDGLSRLPVELITPNEPEALAGIISFKHPDAERLNRLLLDRHIHVMCQAGRVRVSIHGYNTANDVETFLTALRDALNHV
jgi:cysteine desulfurase/selenocysteine lyase